jgi:hypothetical protein
VSFIPNQAIEHSRGRNKRSLGLNLYTLQFNGEILRGADYRESRCPDAGRNPYRVSKSSAVDYECGSRLSAPTAGSLRLLLRLGFPAASRIVWPALPHYDSNLARAVVVVVIVLHQNSIPREQRS